MKTKFNLLIAFILVLTFAFATTILASTSRTYTYDEHCIHEVSNLEISMIKQSGMTSEYDTIHLHRIDTEGLSEYEIQYEINRMREALIIQYTVYNISYTEQVSGSILNEIQVDPYSILCSFGHNWGSAIPTGITDTHHFNNHIGCVRFYFWEITCIRCSQRHSSGWNMDMHWVCRM
ncbi:MAG: hypothetical protein FWC91_07185 [Defluviitaleaceae bacterium]|nr:hypothetical protein [Defluviitaleaceae bacterium]